MATVKELVQAALNEIDKLPRDPSDMHYLVLNESRISAQELINKLNALKDCDQVISKANLSELNLFLSARWQLTAQTQASYFCEPNSRVNSASLIVAKAIANGLNISLSSILLPGVRMTSENTLLNRTDNFFKLHILNHSNQVVYLPAVLQRYQGTRKWEVDGQLDDENDINRIIHHSKFVFDLYENLRKTKGALYKLTDIVDGLKQDSKSLRNDSFSYGYLYNRFFEGIDTIDQLTNEMCRNIPRSEWHSLVCEMDKDFVNKLMCNGGYTSFKQGFCADLKSFNSDLSERLSALPEQLDKLSINEEKKELKVAAFCSLLLRAAYLIRKEIPCEYYSFAGPVLSLMQNMTGVYSKSQKLAAISKMTDFFTGDNRLISFFAYEMEEMQSHLGALAFGETAIVKSKIEGLARYFVPNVGEEIGLPGLK